MARHICDTVHSISFNMLSLTLILCLLRFLILLLIVAPSEQRRELPVPRFHLHNLQRRLARAVLNERPLKAALTL